MVDKTHNNPPEVLELATEVIQGINRYIADTPVVENEDTARAMKLQIDRAKLCLKDLEAERDSKVRPLNDQVDVINYNYRPIRKMLGNLLDEMLKRNELFVKKEEDRLETIALEAAMEANAARQRAVEAERVEQERLDDASKGEVGVDVAKVMSDADEAFKEYERFSRQAALAEKETHVKIGGGLSRAIGMREKELFHIDSLMAAVQSLGPTPDIEAAILKAARSYYRTYKKLPDGISRTMEKHL